MKKYFLFCSLSVACLGTRAAEADNQTMEIIEPVTVISEMGLIQKVENGGMVTYWCKRRNLICKKTTICPMNANQSAVCPAPGSIRIDLYTEDGIKTYIALDEIVSGHIFDEENGEFRPIYTIIFNN